MNQMLSISAAVSKTKTGVQGFSSCVLFLQVLTCGFIVTPDNIPAYYKWIYWWSPLAWTYRALLVNGKYTSASLVITPFIVAHAFHYFQTEEFTSSEYDTIVEETGRTVGDTILIAAGFVDNDGIPFGENWIGYAFANLVPYLSLCVVITGLCLTFIRVEAVNNDSPKSESHQDDSTYSSNDGEHTPLLSTKYGETRNENHVRIPFMPVTLSFENICYDVTASKGTTTLRLLNNVDGIFESGRMTALMGSSGCGKTTLMVSLGKDIQRYVCCRRSYRSPIACSPVHEGCDRT